jgi:hypothetical protein
VILRPEGPGPKGHESIAQALALAWVRSLATIALTRRYAVAPLVKNTRSSGLEVLTRRYAVAPLVKNTRSSGLEVLKGRAKISLCYIDHRTVTQGT